MSAVPRPALWLGLAGLLPFLWGTVTALLPELDAFLGGRFAGVALLTGYGIVILSFMSGVIWGFATRADGAGATALYALSVVPALWAFSLGPVSLWLLALGFVTLLGVDAYCARAGLAPPWWMRLRLLLTTVVAACLVLGALA